MARRMANKAAVESVRKRLGLNLAEFSEALGYGVSAYADMLRADKITETAGLAAECLSRRQSPGAASELVYLTRIVRGAPVITLLDAEVRTMVLDGERFLLIPAEEPRQRLLSLPAAHAGNGAERPPSPNAADYAEPAHA